ncbi:Hypothetical protein CINCED_3A025870 [Cinara cedri]|uniref:Uncharacterized protein n=1 Tax=Cinara cedri TaxID=506608 RepID=A0A5E4NIP8_9HEMI|nr:Hypothetical protein CINCED_3A025870 [Cinara cedri]
MSYNIPSQPVKFIFEITFFFLILVPAGILWACVKKCLPVKRKSVKGQVILITGAAAGLGRQLALLFANLGAKIVCLDINEEGNDKTAQMVKETGAVVASYKCDISKRDQIKDIHQRVKKEIGPVDILINNAAIVWGHIYLDPTKDQLIDDIIDVNLKGQFWMNREIIPSMIDRKSGHIVTISSLAAVCGVAGISSYTATKWATNGMIESMRNELNELNELISSSIKTTTIMPYFINTNPKISERLDCRYIKMCK